MAKHIKRCINPANICWSWRRLVSSTRLQRNNFWCLGRRKFVTLKTPSRRLEHMSSRHLEDIPWRCLQNKSSRRPEDMSSRNPQDVLETKKWGYLYLKNLHRYVSNNSIFSKSVSDESKANPKSSIRTQWFQYSSYFEIQAAFLFWELKCLMTVWCCKISWIQIRHCRTVEAIKRKF